MWGVEGETKIQRLFGCRYEHEFMEDMKSLGVQVPDVLTRITE
jgi:cysteinyl-tRNA synthetase